MTTKQFFVSLAALVLPLMGQAKVRLPHLVSDGMVLQQQSEARLWGWDQPGKTVRVSVSWSSDVYTVRTARDGKWQVKVKTPKAGYTPLSVTFDDGEKTTINGLLSGEVWVCAGQSNMEFPVRGFGNCPLKDYNEVVTTASDVRGIHFVKIPSVMRTEPQDDADCQWKTVDVNTVEDCSAVGYFFARKVSSVANVPVGLILANKGGSRVESWLDADNLKKYTQEELDSGKMVKKFPYDYLRPLLWGNGTFHPILNYTVKGILYYQGCSNVGAPGNEYSDRLKLLVEQWRRDFGEGEIPFYFVQIAPYIYGDGADGISGALLREQQERAASIIPNSALVCTNDLVYPWERNQIHPCQKQPVGERLAFLALNRNYGFKSIKCESPVYKSMFIEGDTCYVSLDKTEGGISRYDDIEGFEVAGADKVFHRAVAGHFWVPGQDRRNETIFVTSPEVKQPKYVRYCFRNFELGNLKNCANLPLMPFRTDKEE
jgi:sialate O-acetylesterase